MTFRKFRVNLPRYAFTAISISPTSLRPAFIIDAVINVNAPMLITSRH